MGGSETYVSYGFSTIFPRDVTTPRFKKQIKYKRSMGEYNKLYFQYKRKYKKRFSESYMKKHLSYASTNMIKYDYDEAKILNYVKYNVNRDTDNILTKKFGSNYVDIISFMYLQEKYGDDFQAEPFMLKDGSDTYDVIDAYFIDSNDVNSDDDFDRIKIILSSESEDITKEIVIDNNYKEKGLYVKYSTNDAKYLYTFIDEETSETFKVKDSDMLIEPVVPVRINDKNYYEKDEIAGILKKYFLNTEDVEEQLEEKDDDGEYLIQSSFLFTAAGLYDPYKVKPGTYNSTLISTLSPKLLEKCKKSDDGKEYTITEETAKWWKEKNRKQSYKYLKYLIQLITKYYSKETYIELGSGSDKIKINTEIEYTHEIINGVLLNATKNGKIIRDYAEIYGEKEPEKDKFEFISSDEAWGFASLLAEMENGEMIIVHQLNDYSYEKLRISFLKQILDHSSETLYVYLNGSWASTGEGGRIVPENYIESTSGYITPSKSTNSDDIPLIYPRLVIPQDFSMHLPFSTYVVYKEYSTSFFIYSEKEQSKSKWKTIVSFAVAIAGCYLIPGAGCTVYSILMNYAISYAIKIVIQAVAEITGIEFLNEILQIAKLIFAVYTGQIDLTDTFQFIKTAQTILTIVNAYNAKIQISKTQEEKENEALLEASESIEESIDNANSSVYKNTINNPEEPADFYYRRTDLLYNYDIYYNYTEHLNVRTTP